MNNLFSIRGERRGTKALLILIMLLFFGLCIASFLYHGERTMLGSFETFDNDDVKYLRSAWTLLETGRLTYSDPGASTVFIMPGLPVVLSGFVALFGPLPILPFRIFQALLLTGGLYVIFLIGRRLFGSKTGLCAAGFMAVYAPFIYATHLLLTESIFCFLFLLLFLFTVYALAEGRPVYYAWGGVFLGLCALFRPTVLAFPVVVLVLWLVKRYRFVDMVFCGGMVVAIVCAILSPWVIRNAVTFRRFIPLTLSSGNPMLQGTFVGYDQSVKESENIDYYNIIKGKGRIDVDRYGRDELVNDAVEREMARIRLREVVPRQPWKFACWYTVGKTIMNWNKPFLWTELFGLPLSFWGWLHYFLLAFGLFGAVRLIARRRMRGVALLPLLTIVLFNVSYLPFYCFPRYMLPCIFCVALLAGCFFCLPAKGEL